MFANAQLFRFILTVLGLSLAEWYIIVRVIPEHLPALVVKYCWPIALSVTFVLVTLDNCFIYPYFRSPLRHLPTVKDSNTAELRLITESPRGTSPLRWITEAEDQTADMLHFRGMFNLSLLIPVSPAALRDVMNTNTYDFQRPRGARAFLSRVLGYGLIVVEGDVHKWQRKALTPSFHMKNIRELYQLMWVKTGILVSEFRGQCDEAKKAGKKSGVVDIAEWASRLTLDIIGPTAMGLDFKSMTEHPNGVAQAFERLLEPSTSKVIFTALHLILPPWIMTRLPVAHNHELIENMNYLHQVCLGAVRNKKAELLRSDRKAVVTEKDEEAGNNDILRAMIENGQFTDEQTVDQMLTFLAAGHETTANALTWLTFLMSRHPDIQEQLRSEIHAWIPDGPADVNDEAATISWNTLESMPLLNGVCEETLRLFPTVPFVMREAKRNTTIAGVTVPKHTHVFLCPYAINRAPRNWGPDAAEFNPWRWIDIADSANDSATKETDQQTRPNKHGRPLTSSNFSNLTFMHGPRACLGRDFAKAELRCAVAALFGQFKVRLVDQELQNGTKMPAASGAVTMKIIGGLWVELEEVPWGR